MSSLLVFNRGYRLEIQSVMLVFSTGFVNCCPSNPLPEYVILDHFNSTPGTLYPRYSITPGKSSTPGLAGVLLNFLNVISWTIFVKYPPLPPPPPSPWQEFFDSRIFCCEDNILHKRFAFVLIISRPNQNVLLWLR